MILFLGFDGVLRPDEAYLVKSRPVLRTEGALFIWAPLLVGALKNHPSILMTEFDGCFAETSRALDSAQS